MYTNDFLAKASDVYCLPLDAATSAAVKFNEKGMLAIADAFERAEHTPNDADVLRTYAALARETLQQFLFLRDVCGFDFQPWEKSGQPYADSREMRRDVQENRRLFFFIGGEMPMDHPLAQKCGIVFGSNGYEASYNDIFRAIHDVFGHCVNEKASFSAAGEFFATHIHAHTFSEAALPALLAETVFQNAWVNFGAHLRDAAGNVPKKGEVGYVKPCDRPYAQQKAFHVDAALMRLWEAAAAAGEGERGNA